MYFSTEYKYVAHMMDEDESIDGIDVHFTPTAVKDFGKDADVVRVTATVEKPEELHIFEVGNQYGALFIARYTVPPIPPTP